MFKNRKKLLFILLVISFLISTNFVFAQGDVVKFRPQIEIPGSEDVFDQKIEPGQEITVEGDTFAKYIISLYNWAIRVIILLAIIMIMIAGFQWMTAAGNAPKVTQAKERIASALIGVLLAVASYTILSFVNPSLVSFRSLDLVGIDQVKISGKCIGDQICVYKDSNKFDCQCKTRVNLWYTVGLTPREGNIKVESGKKCGTVDTVGGTGESRFMCIRMESIYNDCSEDETCILQE